MSSFYAYDFIYDDVPSHKFGLKIITFQDGGLFSGVGSSDVKIITQRVLRKSKVFYLGRTQEPVLEFPLTFGTSLPINAMDRDIISSWLFGKSSYKKLYILQDDLNGSYFNCFLTKPEPLYIGNMNYAFQCSVVCDSPWAYTPEVVVSGSFTGSYYGEGGYLPHYIEIYNKSSEEEYLYPRLSYEILGTGISGTVRLKNLSDVSPTRALDMYVSSGDSVTIDNDLQIVTAVDSDGNTLQDFFTYFSFEWLRLIPKYNRLELLILSDGLPVEYEIRYSERMKVGG